MGRLLYTFDSPRQKRAATIYIYNNDNNQIEVQYVRITRIRIPWDDDRDRRHACVCSINFGRCNSIIYTYHAVYIAGGLVKKKRKNRNSPRGVIDHSCERRLIF